MSIKTLADIEVRHFDRTATDLYVDKPLEQVSIAYKNAEYIAEKAFPKIMVTQETGLIYKKDFSNFAIKDLQRGDKSPSRQSGYNVDTDTTYRIVNYALHDVITKGMKDMAQAPMNPEADAVEDLTDILLLNKEYITAAKVFNTATFSGYTEALSAGGSRDQWDDFALSNPILDVTYAKGKIRTNSGVTSGIECIIGNAVWEALQNHPDLLDRMTVTSDKVVSEAIAAKVLGVDALHVGKTVYNSANEGQTFTGGDVWGKYVLVYHKGMPKLKTSAAVALIDGGNYVRKWTDNDLRGATKVEVENAFECNALSARSAYLLSAVVA